MPEESKSPALAGFNLRRQHFVVAGAALALIVLVVLPLASLPAREPAR